MSRIKRIADKAHRDWLDSDDCEYTGHEFGSKSYGPPFKAGYEAGYLKAIEDAARVFEDCNDPEAAEFLINALATNESSGA